MVRERILSMPSLTFRCTLIFCLLGTITLNAAERTDALPSPSSVATKDALSLNDLQQLALQHNPTLVQARAETWKANGQHLQSGLYPNPEIGYVGTEMGNEGNAGQQGLYFSQTFITGGKLVLSQRIFGARQQAANWEVQAQHYRIENNIRMEYYNILVAQRLVELSKRVENIAREAADTAKARTEQLESSKVIYLQANIELQRANLLNRVAEAELNAAWNRLKAVLGMPKFHQQQLVDNLSNEIPDLSWDATLPKLLELSPEIQRAKFIAQSACAAYERARVQPIPNVTVQAVSQYDHSTEDSIASVQLSMPIPIFNKNQGNIRTAQQEWIRASKEVRRLELNLARQLAEQYKQYNASRAQINLYKLKMLPNAEESLKLSQMAFNAGELNYLQLLTAQRTFNDANIEYVQSLGRLWNSVVAIDGLLLTDGLLAPQDSLQ